MEAVLQGFAESLQYPSSVEVPAVFG